MSPDPGLVQQLRSALADRGLRVEVTATARGAIEQVSTGMYALVIAAVELPDQSGFELSLAVKERAGAPILMLVGEDRDGRSIARAYDAGADAFLHRPVRAAELVGRVEDLMEPSFFVAAADVEDDAPSATGQAASSLVDPMTGVFRAENTGYSVELVDDGDSSGDQPGPRTEELPALAIEQFDERNPVSVPVSPEITAHGMTPVHGLDSVSEPPGRRAVAALGPDTGEHPTQRPPSLQEAMVDRRIVALMAPGGALRVQIEALLADAIKGRT